MSMVQFIDLQQPRGPQPSVRNRNASLRKRLVQVEHERIKHMETVISFNQSRHEGFLVNLEDKRRRWATKMDRLYVQLIKADASAEGKLLERRESLLAARDDIAQLEQQCRAYAREIADKRKELASQGWELDIFRCGPFLDVFITLIRWMLRAYKLLFKERWRLRLRLRLQQKVFSLMKLPGELRMDIYRACLISPHPIDFWPILPRKPWRNHVTRQDMIKRSTKPLNVTLLRLSRQVHAEAIGILYGCNEFRFSDTGGWSMLCGFLWHINTNCQYLTNVSVNYPEWCSVGKWQWTNPLERDGDDFPEMNAILDRLKIPKLGEPIGPDQDGLRAYETACNILAKLPALKELNLVVPYYAKVMKLSFSAVLDVPVRTRKPNVGVVNGGVPELKRTVIFLKKHPQQTNGGLPFWTYIDNDVLMGRVWLLDECRRRAIPVAFAKYGDFEDRTSYISEAQLDMEERKRARHPTMRKRCLLRRLLGMLLGMLRR
ncbi:hypothetical protein BU24DRAFT_445831 [Aaosphaeria arxii CBS 175.79]|uniref:F-box domain-containing protein n=1 Tax=Aaosphaeria arxii CBS 175.79 TaxID=1450172 RepID=A0A6A5Y610_9PLEO|nr:uncharacterized protein BU24DRAFT_445831 [Aaosphaeria arxii CBS 175.79]KAF2020643.1 hypothetical protein BU24DRAFT_445831 [Aaosphaeria arxii CBS 175.79]